MRALIRDFLQSSLTNLTIGEAPDGARGIQLVTEREPRGVLMDVNRPDANGIELTARIKAVRPDTRIIMVTNLAGSAYVERAHAAGASAYVHKDKIYSELLPYVLRALSPLPPHEQTGDDE